MRFLDVFSGIGGFRMGLEQAGHTCIGHIEFNDFARQAYEAIYDIKDDEFDGKDVTEIDDFGKLAGKYDILVGGFPCQSFSIAGNRRGFEDTRGTMFFELARILEQTKPPLCLFENVKGLLSHDKGRTFETILSTLDELGYDVEWKLFNSKDFGVPQKRERVYIVGHLRGRRTRKVFFNSGARSEANDVECAASVPTRYRGTGGETYIAHVEPEVMQIGKLKNGIRNNPQPYRVFDDDGLSPTLSTAQGGGTQPHIKIKSCTKKGYEEAKPGDGINIGFTGSKTRRGRVGDQIANTLTTSGTMGTLENINGEHRTRRLTPREYWRLQGFPDWAFDRAKATGLSDTQLYKQAGNAVTVNVVRWIGERMTK